MYNFLDILCKCFVCGLFCLYIWWLKFMIFILFWRVLWIYDFIFFFLLILVNIFIIFLFVLLWRGFFNVLIVVVILEYIFESVVM